MTNEEFERYQKAIQLKEKIDFLENEIEYINDVFINLRYPRTESSWQLSFILNNDLKSVNLTAELFKECVNFVKTKKLEELNKYKEDFDKL